MAVELDLWPHPELLTGVLTNLLQAVNQVPVLGLGDQNTCHVVVIGAVRLVNEQSHLNVSRGHAHESLTPHL